MFWLVMFIAVVLALAHWQIAVWVIGVPVAGLVLLTIWGYAILIMKHYKEVGK